MRIWLESIQEQLRPSARPMTSWPRHDPAIVQSDASEAVVDDLERVHNAFHYPDAAGSQLLQVLLIQRRSRMAEQHEISGQLTEHQHLVHRHRPGRQHAHCLIAHLPTVAVRTVEYIATPAFAHSGYVRQLIHETGGDEQPSRIHNAPIVQCHGETISVTAGRADPRLHHLAASTKNKTGTTRLMFWATINGTCCNMNSTAVITAASMTP